MGTNSWNLECGYVESIVEFCFIEKKSVYKHQLYLCEILVCFHFLKFPRTGHISPISTYLGEKCIHKIVKKSRKSERESSKNIHDWSVYEVYSKSKKGDFCHKPKVNKCQLLVYDLFVLTSAKRKKCNYTAQF